MIFPASGSRWRVRLLATVLLATILTPLGVARTLSPAPTGLGTHRQLGLPPCSMQVLFQMRCPACGMTTSWSYWTRGQWWASASANAGGACLAFLVTAIAIVAGRAAWTGQLPLSRTSQRLGWAILAVGVVTLVDWAVRLAW